MSYAPEAARAAGISYRQLDYWTRHGYLLPTRQQAGSGYRRDYDDDQIRRARTLGALVNAGLTLEAAGNACRQLEADTYAALGIFRLTYAPACELCGDPLTGDDLADVHDDCLEQYRRDLDAAGFPDMDQAWWQARAAQLRRVEDVPDDQGRFS